MRMIIHDIDPQELAPPWSAEDNQVKVIADNGTIRKCIGCFACWIQTPGACVMKDDYRQMGEWLAGCDELVIISKCAYGSYSPFVKNVLDRGISYVLPYFTSINGETHHQQRYDNRFKLTAHFYGEDITAAEQDTARALVAANGANLHTAGYRAIFHPNVESIWEGWQ